jgi:hypothetical protein
VHRPKSHSSALPHYGRPPPASGREWSSRLDMMGGEPPPLSGSGVGKQRRFVVQYAVCREMKLPVNTESRVDFGTIMTVGRYRG